MPKAWDLRHCSLCCNFFCYLGRWQRNETLLKTYCLQRDKRKHSIPSMGKPNPYVACHSLSLCIDTDKSHWPMVKLAKQSCCSDPHAGCKSSVADPWSTLFGGVLELCNHSSWRSSHASCRCDSMVVVEEVGIGCVARLAKDDKDCQAIGFRYAAGLFVKPLHTLFSMHTKEVLAQLAFKFWLSLCRRLGRRWSDPRWFSAGPLYGIVLMAQSAAFNFILARHPDPFNGFQWANHDRPDIVCPWMALAKVYTCERFPTSSRHAVQLKTSDRGTIYK